MGQFSWIYSDTQRQVVDNRSADTYLLVPPEFQHQYGKAIYESCYDGYGHFGVYDIYELIAEWNRKHLSETMLCDKPEIEDFGGLFDFEKEKLRNLGFSEAQISKKDLEKKEYYYNAAVKRYENSIKRLVAYRNGATDQEMTNEFGKYWKREIGIDIACYDEQNTKLPCPIKITSCEMDYKDVKPSLSDPNQGWV